jgi:hypothetical protein
VISDKADIWHAMSELYLDESLSVGGCIHIAERLASSGPSLEDLDAIFYGEVHPALWWNLATVAGEWGVFEKTLVVDLVEKGLAEAREEAGWWSKLRRIRDEQRARQVKELVRCDWEKVKLLIEVIRGRGLRESSECERPEA